MNTAKMAVLGAMAVSLGAIPAQGDGGDHAPLPSPDHEALERTKAMYPRFRQDLHENMNGGVSRPTRKYSKRANVRNFFGFVEKVNASAGKW